MFKAARRLRAVEVREVIARGRGRRGVALSLKMMPAAPPFRCAVVVSKKVGKTAVVRNRMRRSVYAALKQTSLPPSGHAILFVQAVPPENPVSEFASDLKKLLHV